MPRGRKKKIDVAVEEEPKNADAVIAKAKDITVDPVPLSERERQVIESRKSLNTALLPHQAFFEAPDGLIIIGDADKDHAWDRGGNDGEGMKINRMR